MILMANILFNRGYVYALPEYLTTDRIRKKNPLCGHLMGIWYCAFNDIIM